MRSPNLPPLILNGKTLLPIVQGGMGVGISAHRLAGTVASLNGVGTIASIDLRRLHPDLMEQTGRSRDKEVMNDANLIALHREIRAAKELAQGRGMVAVNVMRAVTEYPELVLQACESGADAIVMGAGLPLDLPDLTRDFPEVALIPILSDVRGVALVLKKWARKNRMPDAIVIEHPRYAGGHLGAAKPEDVADARFDFETVLPGLLQLYTEMGIQPGSIPIIPAGGINTHERLRELISMGASAAQLGTPFAVSEEGDAHPNFKRVLAEAKPEDITTFVSVAGLPARAVKTPWLVNYLKRLPKLCAVASANHKCSVALDCLVQCGLRDGIAKYGQFCIDAQLAAALRGDVDKGLFFRGSERLPFGSEIRPVKDLVNYMVYGEMPATRIEPAEMVMA